MSEPLKHTNYQVRAMMRATRAILEYESFEKSARIIFDEARDLIHAKAGYIALLSDDGKENEVLFLEAGGDKCTVDPSLPMPIRGLRANAYKDAKVVYNNSFMSSKHKQFLPDGHVLLKNVLFAPLIIKSKVVGIMGLANKPTDFNEDDARIAQIFGEYAAIALKNSRNLDILRETISKLESTIQEVKQLKGLLPICSKCKKIRDDDGYWHQVEEYVSEKSEALFTHSLCPSCIEKLYPEIHNDIIQEKNQKTKN